MHLSEHHGDCCPGSAIRVDFEGLEEYNTLLLEKKYKNSRPGIEDMPWGTRDMSIKDPFGNRITFSAEKD